MRIRLVTCLLLVGAFAAHAQGTASSCTYDQCALWLRDGRVQVGMPGTRLRGGAAALLRLTESSDSANAHARLYVRRERITQRMFWIGSAAVLGSLASMTIRRECCHPNPDDANVPEIIGFVGGTAVLYGSIPFSVAANRSLHRTIWWYNRGLR